MESVAARTRIDSRFLLRLSHEYLYTRQSGTEVPAMVCVWGLGNRSKDRGM